jgi:hypothetical protein
MVGVSKKKSGGFIKNNPCWPRNDKILHDPLLSKELSRISILTKNIESKNVPYRQPQ